MKKVMSLCLLGAMCLCFPLTASAEKLDMSQLTCAAFMELDGDETAMMYFWLDGYVSHMTKNNVIDTSTIEADIRALLEHCEKNPKVKILDMLKSN